MKIISILFIVLSTIIHNKHTLKSRFTNLYHLKSKLKVRFKYSSNHGLKISLNNLNRLHFNKRVNLEDEIVFDQENAPDMFYGCQSEAERLKKMGKQVNYQDLFAKYITRLIKAFDKLEQNVKDAFWIYFVEDQGKCRINNENAGVVFMLLPQGDPRYIDFSDPNMKVPFLKVCINGKPNSKLGLSLTQDPNKKEDDKKEDDKQKTNKDEDGKQKTTKDEDGKQKNMRFVQIKKSGNDNEEGLQPYLLKYCAFDDCITTPLYKDREVYTDEETEQEIRGRCHKEIDENESITLNNDSEYPARLRVMSPQQCNSLGRLMN